MAKRYDPTSQDYPETLGMPPGDDTTGQYYGFSDDQIGRMKKAGITVGDLQGMGILRSPEMTTPGQGYTGGTVGGQVMSDTGRQQLQNAAMLKASLAGANQPQQQQPAAQTTPSYLGITGLSGGQTYGTYTTPGQAIPRGYNLYSPPASSMQMWPSSGVSAMSDLAVQPPLIQPLGSSNLGQMTNRQASSFLG